MDFVTAAKTCLSKYVDFNGRAIRSEFWFFYLFYIVIYIATFVVDMLLASIGIPPLLTIIVALGLFLPYLAVTIRRLHDTNRSGWWILIGFIPLVGLIVMLIFLCTKGTDGSNDFGPDPFKGDLAEQF